MRLINTLTLVISKVSGKRPFEVAPTTTPPDLDLHGEETPAKIQKIANGSAEESFGGFDDEHEDIFGNTVIGEMRFEDTVALLSKATL